MRPSQLLAAIVALSSVSAAFPDVFDGVNAVGEMKHAIFGRQDNNENSRTQAESSATPTAKETEEAKETNSQQSAKESAKETGKETGKASGTQKGTATRSGKAKETEFDPRLPAGGISMITPAAIAGPQFYKVGEWITFAWNYTSLSVTPSAVDILATCSQNQATYTIAVNQSVEATGRVLWDTKSYQEDPDRKGPPFLTASYTLLIYDSDLTVSATAKAGYLGVYNQFTFGMYTPQPYTPWSAGYKCATCSGANPLMDKSTFNVLLLTTGTTIASLLYFAHNFGMW